MFRNIFTVILTVFILSCGSSSSFENSSDEKIDYREEMRNFVINISHYAKEKNEDFIVIPQNGVEIITDNGEPDGNLVMEYINAIDGQSQEDLFYGWEEDNLPTPEEETEWLTGFLDRLVDAGKKVLVVDYCTDKDKIDDSYNKSAARGYISTATCRELNCIPPYPPHPFNENNDDINNLSDARNFLYLINPENFDSKEDFLQTLENTNFDLLIIDAFYKGELLTKEDIDRLKTKQNGGKRLVIAYMSIGEAEDYRYYWKEEWNENPPEWLDEENPDWPGNYKVKYWMKDWQKIIYGSNDSYLDRILSSGFDGVYLDIIDAYEYFEEKDSEG